MNYSRLFLDCSGFTSSAAGCIAVAPHGADDGREAGAFARRIDRCAAQEALAEERDERRRERDRERYERRKVKKRTGIDSTV